ncbi:MAG: hypothetical protein COV59_00350 [Candidatus Magasanikbacteria bacterium CG11_big_fil_rev_8_21_14_0_20_39_34]|uniref:Uncharacterized protein n=1 Tax=Candidatus Magasanikbacteria bacterium CG11_big_fil_rev_8_21_14_0_20_39_34 TaxID=1974653 RepID=A0A2H0N6P1_9BACT|nr:MAG: hypothetical protein COV59_00350 [Candidatus Magasanikbacteria bacterium CG11_big_fil_rev_8_21_14_0_20_39_34]
MVGILAFGVDPPPLGVRLDLRPVFGEDGRWGPGIASLLAGGAPQAAQREGDGGVHLRQGVLGQGGRGQGHGGGEDQGGDAGHDESPGTISIMRLVQGLCSSEG